MGYDRADYDYSTEDLPLPKGHAATHIGMFLAWVVLNGLENELHRRNSATQLEQLKRREITGRQLFELVCNEQFAEKDLNPEANSFAELYYRNAAGERGLYFDDYRKVLAAGLPSFWHVADTWENYDRLAPVLTKRFNEWKNPPVRKWWQFWK